MNAQKYKLTDCELDVVNEPVAVYSAVQHGFSETKADIARAITKETLLMGIKLDIHQMYARYAK
jgi:hypothetical protein